MGTSTRARVVENHLAVALAPGEPAEYQVYARLTVPPGPPPTVVQLLSGSFLWDHRYWHVPDLTHGTDRYDWTAAATRAGFATLALDRIGIGRSSKPPATEVDAESNVHVNHQVAQALRDGRFTGPDGPIGFGTVVGVGHSFSAAITELILTRFPEDFDLAVLSGFTHNPRFDNLRTRVVANLQAAPEEGYHSTTPGSRQQIFYSPALSDPILLAHDEHAGRATMTDGEWDSVGPMLGEKLDIRVPVLLALGGSDPLFARSALPESTFGTDASSVAAFLAEEGPHLGRRVPDLQGFLLSGAGHNLNVMPNAEHWFAVAHDWLLRRADPRTGLLC